MNSLNQESNQINFQPSKISIEIEITSKQIEI